MRNNKLGVVMDPPEQLCKEKDTTLSLIGAANSCGWITDYIAHDSLNIENGVSYGRSRPIEVSLTQDQTELILGSYSDRPLQEYDVILMRQDPPVNTEYMYNCQILSLAKQAGVLVINDPDSLRLFNEKLIPLYFTDVTVPNMVSKNIENIIAFIEKEQDVVLKPLDSMGGNLVHRVSKTDHALKSVVERLSHQGVTTIIAQKVIPQWEKGDKRIFIIGGKPIEQALLRVPPPGKFLANLVAGGRGEPSTLSNREKDICKTLAPFLTKHKLRFVGIDVINGFLTEVNITSPTGIREVNKFFNVDLAVQFIHEIEKECGISHAT